MRDRKVIALGLVLVVVIGIASPAIAHEEQTVEGYDLTFGGADEPVITNERMWLELEIIDNETGEPVTNQSVSLKISVQKAGHEKVELDVSEKHSEPGVYQVPVIFTESGDYMIHVEGSIEETEIHTHFEKEVQDASELEYPTNESVPDDNETVTSNNETGMSDNKSQSIADGSQSATTLFPSGVGIAVIGISVVTLVGAVGAFLLRRQR